MTELSFLLELLLNHKLPQATKKAVTERVKEVEAGLSTTRMYIPSTSGIDPSQISAHPRVTAHIPPHLVGQAPSTIAAMMRNGFVPEPPSGMAQAVQMSMPAPPEPQPVAVVAQTPAAAAAMNDRQNAIAQAISGKPEKGRTSPRKF